MCKSGCGCYHYGCRTSKLLATVAHVAHAPNVSCRIFQKGGGGGGGNHLTTPTYQETVPITNALTARMRLWQKFKMFLNSCVPFCYNSCHFAAVYALKPPYYNTCADSKGGGGGGGFSKGGKSPP